MVTKEHEYLIIHPRPSAMTIKRKGERGSPCQIPLEGEKLAKGESLTKIEKKVEDRRDKIHLVQEGIEPKAKRNFLM